MPSAKRPEIGLELTDGFPGAARRAAGAMRILIMGDFSGRAGNSAVQSNPEIHERSIFRVDVDNLDELLGRLAPRIRVEWPGGEGSAELELRSLDDFRPESLYERLAVFRELRGIRERLLDPQSHGLALAELQSLLCDATLRATAANSEEATSAAPAENDSETIERLLGRPATGNRQATSERPTAVQAAVRELIDRAVAPHVVSQAPPHLDVYLGDLEEAVSGRMRSLLHAPVFQSLEAAWLSLHHLVTNLETDEGLQVHLLDVSRQELEADLASAAGDIKASGLYRLLVERTGEGTPGGEPWSLLVGNFELGPEPQDLGLLAVLGIIAASAGGPFLAAASPRLLGCRSLAQTPDPPDWSALPADAEAAWTGLRQSPIAPWVGLAAPKVLLRLPYGRDSDPVETFEFEEFGPERRHSDYLWGNPAFACALLIGQAFTASGWSMTPGDALDIGELPAHVYEEGGGKQLQACAETYLSERAATAILDRGIMPLLSFKGRDLVRLARFQSIASPPAALMGSWRG